MKKKRERCRLSLKKLSCSFDHVQNNILNQEDLTIVVFLVREKTTKEIINHKGTRTEKIDMDFK